MAVLDFHVEIGAGGEDGYPVTVQAPDGGEAATTMRLPLSAELEKLTARIPDAVIASSARVRRSAVGEEVPIQRLGSLLFAALLTGDGRALLIASRHRATREHSRLRMVLHVNAPELTRLPWEFLYDPGEDTYLCLAAPLIRHPQVLTPQSPLRVTAPLRILCMIARPDDQQALAVHDEQRRLQQALADLVAQGRVEIGWVAGQSWRDLRRALQATADGGNPWHVFHFIGHGGFNATAQEGTLALSGEYGGTYHLGAQDLAMVLNEHPSLRLVVLNACETGRASTQDPFSSVAGALMRKGMPAVLAMQYPISDQAAIECSRTFYESLADRLPVDVAVMKARQAIRLSLPGTLEWGTPVLYMRSLDGHLFDLTAAPRIRPTPRVHPSSLRDGPRGDTRAQAGREKLEELYTQGLGALYTEQWDAAVEVFRAVIAQDRGYKNSEARLEQARHGQRLAALYAAGTEAAAAGEWAATIEHLAAVVAIEPGYRDAQVRLEQARHDHAVAQLRDEAAALHRARQWQAVLVVGERLKQLAPDAADPDGLISSARAELAAAHRAQALALALAKHYRQALDYMEAGRWQQALEQLTELHRLDPDYSNSAQLAAHARRQLSVHVRRELAKTIPIIEHPTLLTTITAPKAVNAVAFSPAATRLALALEGRIALIVDLAGNERLRLLHNGWFTGVNDIAYTPDGRRLATAGNNKTVRIWDTATGNQLLQVTHTGWVFGVAFSPDGRRFATAGDTTVRIWDIATDGNNKTVRIWDTATGNQLLQVAHTSTVFGVAFSPDGRRFATAGDDHTARIWDAATGNQLLQVTHTGTARGVAFSPDGRRFATTGDDHTARIWDAATGNQLLQVTHTGTARGVAFSPDGRRFATTGDDHTARIWDAATGNQLLHVTHTDWVFGVAFSPDGALLATASRDKTVQLWRLG